MRTARIVFAAVLGALVSSPAVIEAQGPPTGHVVRLDGDDVVLDLGAPSVRDGARLAVYRTIRLRHPLTRQPVEDRFVIAWLEVRQAGTTLSLARLVGDADRPLQVGDVVEVERAMGTPTPLGAPEGAPAPTLEPHAAPVAAHAAPAPRAADEEALLAMFRDSRGASPEERITRMEQFVRAFPGSPLAAGIERDIEALRVAAEGASVPAAPTAEQQRQLIQRAVRARVYALALTEAHADQPVFIGLLLEPSMGELQPAERGVPAQPPASRGMSDLDAVSGFELYARSIEPGAPAEFTQVSMHTDDIGHTRARVPAELVHAPGFEFFVVAVSGVTGAVVSVMGDSAHPQRVRVPASASDPAPTGPRARVRLESEVASFDGASGDDWYVAAGGDFLYRVQRGFVHAVRVGYGHYRGRGPADIDDPSTVRSAGFSYGFFETELRLHRLFALVPRVTVGLGLGSGGNSEVRGGFQLRVRIGPDDGTNLVLGAETIPEIGQRAFIGLSFVPRPRWPMAVEVHVTDQPVNEGELAVRGILEVGRQLTDTFALSLRASYQGRSIDHAGLGAGLALTFDW
ncbi:MAG: hypothetical protein H6726_03155 [Sandaracinaceae bacterium]|nr:hypothetical protein [Sandaracinaceae bacterium]